MMTQADAVVLGAALVRLRTQGGVQQAHLAELAGISQSHLSRFERGERAVDRRTYAKLLTALADLAREGVGAA